MKIFLTIITLLGTFIMNAQSLYFPPTSLNDTSWQKMSLSDAGWCENELDTLLDYLESKETKAFIILKDGKIVIEKYFGNPAMTNAGEIIVNGWSPSRRNNPFANSGMVVSVNEEDFKPFKKHGELAALYFQQQVEQKCFVAGGSNLQAPAQRVTDFVDGKTSASLPENSYYIGTSSINLHEVLPLSVSTRLKEGLIAFSKKMKGYYTQDALMVATESRTSSPVKIPRDKENLYHPQIKNLFPCGEGAGYAGGIVSAAIDGERCAEAVFNLLH